MLIQRRLTRLNDKVPPRLGIVQVKFLQDARTTAYIHASYVRDESGPLREFFVLVFTGRGDNARTFLLSAEDVANNFSVAPADHTRANRYVLGGSALLSDKFKLESVERGLDRIEQALRLADLERNRRYLFHSTAFFERLSRDQIEPEFLVPLDNDWGDISEEFYSLKKRAESALRRVDEFAESLRNIIASSEPENALSIAEELDMDTRDGNLWFGKRIYEEDLHITVLRHRERHDELRDAGLLDTYLKLCKEIEAFIVDDLLAKLPVQEGMGYLFSVTYDPVKLSDAHFQGTVEATPKRPEQERRRFDRGDLQVREPGHVKYLWSLDHVARMTSASRAELMDRLWQIRRPVAEAIYELRFGEQK